MNQSDPHTAVPKLPRADIVAPNAPKEGAIASVDASLITRIVQLEAELQAEREQNNRQRALERLASETRTIRSALSKQKPTPATLKRTADEPKEVVALNLPFDTEWAQIDDRFRSTLHVFHQGWHGIRAAAGFMPGNKLVLPANREMNPDELRRAVSFCTPFDAIVFHGFSRHAEVLLTILRKHGGSKFRTYAVWHGSTAQFHAEHEQGTFANLVSLKRRGLLNGFASVKPDMHLLSEHIYAKALVNVPPRVASRPPRRDAPSGRVLVPVRNNFWKNFYTNVYAASGHPLVKEVLVTSHYGHQRDFALGTNVVEVQEPERRELLMLTAMCDLVLNVTLTDCQPMTAVEALAMGVPCLTGELALPELSEHPYQRLITVQGSDSIGQVRKGIDRVLTMRHSNPAELTGLISDYQKVVLQIGLDRLAEFIAA